MLKFPQPQPACTGFGLESALYWDRRDCGFGWVGVAETTPASTVVLAVVGSDGSTLATQTLAWRAEDNAWEFDLAPAATWPAGTTTLRVVSVDGVSGDFGETTFLLNQLGATVGATGTQHTPGQSLTIVGNIYELDEVPPLATAQKTNVGASFKLRVARPDGTNSPVYGPFTANALNGSFSATIPGSATAGLSTATDDDFAVTVGIEVIDAAYADPVTGAWSASLAGVGSVRLGLPSAGLVLENSFVSSVGWVKPGETYPSRVTVKNYTTNPATAVSVAIPAVAGMTYTNAVAAGAGSGTCSASGGGVSWTIATDPGRNGRRTGRRDAASSRRARGRSAQDPQVVWKDLSTTATLIGRERPSNRAQPRARRSSRPSERLRHRALRRPAVPGRARSTTATASHEAAHTGDALADKINSPDVAGSTFNLYQEMSLRAALPARRRALGRHRHARLGRLRPGLPVHARRHPPAPATARPTPTCRAAIGSAALPRADPRRLVPAAGRHRLLRRRQDGLGAGRRP